MTNQFQYME